MKLAIVTATFQKLDGSTYQHLKSALESVKNQTHKDYKIFLIGDDYTDNDELMELSKIIDEDKIYVENLPIAAERTKYSGIDLWRNGGVNANNVGIKRALKENYNYVCHLDHDDIFLPNHLELISECIEKTNTNFVTTKCKHPECINIYPPVGSSEFYTKYRPINSSIFKVTTCVNYAYYNFLFRNMIEECGVSYAADADLWNRITEDMTNKNEFGYCINSITCIKTPDGNTIKSPESIKK
jgi:glycosyltransferase involved in cell wall biosynthesis